MSIKPEDIYDPDNKKGIKLLTNEYNFSSKRSEETQKFLVTTEVVTHRSNGKLRYVDRFKLYITREVNKYTCTGIFFQHNDKPEVSVPSLKDWSYNFDVDLLNNEGIDDQGVMLGIPHTKFENLRDSRGKKVSIEAQYQIYSTFSYFHSWCNMTPEKYSKDLKKVGDEVVNDLSEVESPVNLGKLFCEGSKFLHGIETIQFKGIGIIDDTVCAILSLKERGGGFNMKMKPMPVLRVKTKGGTYYNGDIYVDLESLHVKKVHAIVVDITKTTMYGMPVQVAVPVTTITVESVKENVLEMLNNDN